MNIEAIGHFESPLSGKFGIPRQSGLAADLRGRVVLHPPYNVPDALRGLDDFDYLWLIWGFNLNKRSQDGFSATVRPPRLGGNVRVGVFASRSPFRPNSLGLSAVKILKVEPSAGVIEVSGADLADGTPIYDIKPYVSYADAHPEARSGFVDSHEWQSLKVVFPDSWMVEPPFGETEMEALREILAQDPRPQFQHDEGRIYGFAFNGKEIHFRVEGDMLEVV